MADNKKVQEENLKKLEDQAYFELCQIIAEAMQYQDVELLNARIASWKTKYKKLLDRPSTNSKSDFKKRIEFLLTQYYSEVTKYILSQLKLHEEKKVEKQSKALRELYTIIRDTNDYTLLKKKVEKWKEKYPVSGFLKMYQKRIELYTRDKNLRENAFKQEEAFSDLVDVTKVHGTLDELKSELALWEEKYSINDKYSIDDFLKHQNEVKRFTSDEFLQSIAREDPNPDNIDKNEVDIAAEYNNKSFSDLSIQASSYAALLKISKSPNAVNEMFTWVYKNRGVKFNDKYKELILSATYLDYSPKYLNKMAKPKMDMSKSSLSFDEYSNINDIKRYAIISYFNLLLPPEKAVPNDYFNKHIQTIYAKSERARVSDIKEDNAPVINSSVSEIKIVLDQPAEETTVSYIASEVALDMEEPLDAKISEPIVESTKTDTINNSEIVLDLSDVEPELTVDIPEPVSDEVQSTDKAEEIAIPETIEDNSITVQNKTNIEIEKIHKKEEVSETQDVFEAEESPEKESNSEKALDYTTVVAVSPLFFEAINNYDKQAVLVGHIDSTVTEYVEAEKSKELSIDKPVRTKIDEE